MDKKVLWRNIFEAAKISAVTALIMLGFLAFSLIPVSLVATGDPFDPLVHAYIICVFVCIGYLFLFALGWILSKMKDKYFRIAFAILTITAVISCGSLVQTCFRNRSIDVLETHWGLTLPGNTKVNFRRSAAYGFVGDLDELRYRYLTLKSPWTNGQKILTNTLSTSNYAKYKVFGMGGLAEKFPSQKQQIYFRLLFEQTLNKFRFPVPSKYLPEWNNWSLEWGLTEGQVGDSRAVLFVIFIPETMRLTLFEYVICSH